VSHVVLPVCYVPEAETARYAANAIVLPSLDMMSNLRPEHASDLIAWLTRSRDKGDDMWQFWRGRYGLTEIEQAGVWGGVGWAHGEEKRAEELGTSKRADSASSDTSEMVTMSFKTYEGEMKQVEASTGETLLEIGKREGLPAIEGVCGGKLGEWAHREIHAIC
jgi:hypothetical protein